MALCPLTRSINKVDIDLFLNYKIKKAEKKLKSSHFEIAALAKVLRVPP